ncbi:DUF6025 family protein [Corallococcus sp. RDP092CA]|uniref:DUF6025 family protein n=1 Tax=Corallococcus sp. RDP092CA TaxID=3109369 RepID=UPI0035AEA028
MMQLDTLDTGRGIPLTLAEALSLEREVARLAAGKRRGPLAPVAEFESRKRAFDWVDLGQTELPLGTLFEAIRRVPRLRPPRTGHIGNWEEIVQGRAGALDFNKAIVDRGLGYPLIYSLTRTEDHGLENGDTVYVPGSLVHQGARRELPLYTWDGADFARRTREAPLFTPFVLAEVDGARIPVVSLHWRKLERHPVFPFVQEETFFRTHEPAVRAALEVLLEAARHQKNPRNAYFDLISHQIGLDGSMQRVGVEPEGAGYRMGEVFYASAAELVDASMIPYRAATDPMGFVANVASLPQWLPRLSGTVTTLLLAMLNTHYPDGAVDRATMTRPFNPHLHWGARDMAGYPPVRPGYFARSSSIKSAQWICDTLIKHFQDFDPLLFVLAPAAVFMLCPSSSHPCDAERVADLFHALAGIAPPGEASPEAAMDPVREVVQGWLARSRPELSSYFLSRFHPRRGLAQDGEVPAHSDVVEPEGFRGLSVAQACRVVGALVQLLEPPRSPNSPSSPE